MHYFVLRRLASRNESDFRRCRIGVGPEVNDREHRAVGGAANREPAILDVAVFQVGDGEQPRIFEDGAREFEGHAMTAHVGNGLGRA